jgi:hypothetical protein
MSDVEAALREIMRRHLGGQEVGLDDDFYALGGDSLIALRVVADANGQGIPVELRDILFHPTVRELAAALADRDHRPGAGATGAEPFGLLDPYDRAMVPPGVVDARPAAALQVGLIYLCETSRDPGLYHDLIGFEVVGHFDEGLFARALADLCERHEALRSSFDLGGFSEPLQLVWSSVPAPLAVVTSSTVDAVARWREEQIRRGIDWSTAPAFRCHVVALAGSFHVTLAIHHAIIDGWSYARLVLELLLLYDAGLGGRAAELPPLPATGYGDFLRLERAAIDRREAADFWRAEADVPALLFDRARLAGPADPTARVSFPLDPATLEDLRAAATRIGVPLKSLVLGCHAWALHRWTGRERDVVTGVTVNGRPEATGADLLVGLFLNSVPLRFREVPDGWAGAARTALAAEQRVLPHRRYPLARIEQGLGRPAFDVSFNFTHFHTYGELGRLRELTVGAWWSFDKTSFPMLVEFMIDSRRLGTGVEVVYDPAMVAAARVMEFVDLYRDALAGAAKGDR